jgi:uncharacterized protein (DUF58 family)
MTNEHVLYVRNPGPRPAFCLVAEHLWGVGCNFDSEGNSRTPLDTEWVELYVALRGTGMAELVQIEAVSESPLVLAVRSSRQDLCTRAAEYLASKTGGKIAAAA